MNIHTRLVGAFDAIIMSLTAALTLVMVFVLFNPLADGGRAAEEHESRQAVLAHVASEAAPRM